MQTASAPVVVVSCKPGACMVPRRTYYTLIMADPDAPSPENPTLRNIWHLGRHQRAQRPHHAGCVRLRALAAWHWFHDASSDWSRARADVRVARGRLRHTQCISQKYQPGRKFFVHYMTETRAWPVRQPREALFVCCRQPYCSVHGSGAADGRPQVQSSTPLYLLAWRPCVRCAGGRLSLCWTRPRRRVKANKTLIRPAPSGTRCCCSGRRAASQRRRRWPAGAPNSM